MREPVTRERAVEAAIAVADSDGIKALTMRRLAADLGIEAMSLYHHFPGKKDALLDGLIDGVISEITAAASSTDHSSGDWRVVLRQRFLAARTVMLRHRWAPPLLASRTVVPPALYTYYEEILRTLAEAGFSYRIAHRALHTFGSMALGFTQEIFSPDAAGDSAMQNEVEDAQLAAMAEVLPHLTAMVAAELHDLTDPALGWCDSQTEFEFTLDLILDGLERLR